MSVELLAEHHLEFLSLKRGCIGSSESTLVKMPHCWKSHVMAHLEINHTDIGEHCLEFGCQSMQATWMKVFEIITEFRVHDFEKKEQHPWVWPAYFSYSCEGQY